MDLNQIHLDALVSSIPNFQNQHAVGHNPQNFIKSIISAVDDIAKRPLIEIQGILPNRQLSRSDIFDICNSSQYSLLYKTVCIFAWGFMSKKNPRIFFENWTKNENRINNILIQFQQGNIDRVSAYNLLNHPQLPGCGPAFFTKLLYFFSNGQSYIMDQWTGKSIELLFLDDARIGIIINNGSIARRNNGATYEAFCTRIERLTSVLNNQTKKNLTAEMTEEILFSNGGRGNKQGAWRKYLKENF